MRRWLIFKTCMCTSNKTCAYEHFCQLICRRLLEIVILLLHCTTLTERKRYMWKQSKMWSEGKLVKLVLKGLHRCLHPSSVSIIRPMSIIVITSRHIPARWHVHNKSLPQSNSRLTDGHAAVDWIGNPRAGAQLFKKCLCFLQSSVFLAMKTQLVYTKILNCALLLDRQHEEQTYWSILRLEIFYEISSFSLNIKIFFN